MGRARDASGPWYDSIIKLEVVNVVVHVVNVLCQLIVLMTYLRLRNEGIFKLSESI
jgi:hypothetical protein